MARTVTLSVKNVPTTLAKRLRERAQRNNRSLQGELLDILNQAGQRQLTLDDLARVAKQLGISSDRNESTQWIRDDRDDPRR
jgi:plasmid stability protein